MITTIRALVVFLPLTAAQIFADPILPANRQTVWQGNVGMPGGIPYYLTGVNVRNAPYSAKGDGVTDDTAAVQAAINACSNFSAVYFPSGTYRITNSLFVPVGYPSPTPSIVLRGDGPGKTVIALDTTNQVNVIKINHGTQVGPYIPITNGLAQGSHTITLSNALGINIGTILSITELNDTNFVSTNTYTVGSPCTYCGENGQRVLQQYVLVTNVSGNTLGINPPLLWNYTPALAPTAQSTVMITNCGVESMTVTRLQPSATSYAEANCILISGAAWCWVTNVETSWPQGAHIKFQGCFQCEADGNYHHDGWTQNSGQDYGVMIFDHNSNLLIQNSIFKNMRHAMVFEAGGAACVFAYNFSTNPIAGENADNFLSEDQLTHGAHAWFNLYEGNVSVNMVGDFAHGSASHNTYFRQNIYQMSYLEAGVIRTNQSVTNIISAGNADGNADNPPYFPTNYPGAWVMGPAPVTNPWNGSIESVSSVGVSFQQWTHSNNVVGCVFTTNGLLIPFQFGATNSSQIVPFGHGAIVILGASSAGGTFGTPPVDPVCGQSTYWHGNWDAVTQGVLWDGSNTNHIIPNSLYLTNKPSWWGAGPWPPIGPDISPMVTAIPAQVRLAAKPLAPVGLRIGP